jgi:4-methylaminobutanoate oxidase (formaldehyde-forming)
MGWKDIMIVEKGELTSGSTWHAAGLVGQLRSNRNVTRMLKYSVELYEKLEEETGLATGWKKSGCLRLACSEARLSELKRGATMARGFGLDMHIISPQEAHDLFPIMSMDGVMGAAFIPSDGEADPNGLTMAMAKGAKNRGAEINRQTLVTGFEIKDNRVAAVITDRGRIRCEILVIAAGMWAREVGRMAGVNVPLIPVQHQFIVTEKIDEVPPDLPTMRDPDNLIYYKREVGGLVMGGYEHDPIPWALDGIPKDFSQKLLAPDFEHFETLSRAAVKRTPCLETAGVVRLINGPEAFTPDGDCIMGQAPELDNCFVAAGFNAFGIAAGGGAGRMLAEWIVEGEPSLDLWPLDIRRFGQYHSSPRYIRDRTLEIYAKHYAISWPNEEHHSARGIKRSPLYYVLKDKGAVYGARFGWERANWFAPEGVEAGDKLTFGIPNWFEHVASEHESARERVVLIDQSSFSKFEIEGPGALEFLNRLGANNVDKPVGSVTYTQLCNERGGVECDITISHVADERFFIITGTAFGVHDSTWVKSHMPQDGSVVLRDITSSFAMLNICGPNSRKLLEKATRDDVSNENFKFSGCRNITVGYAPVLALRVTYVGELGYELYIPPEYAGQVYELLWEEGQELGVSNAGYRAIESLRLEKGYCYWSTELTPDYTPYDAGLGFCVALEKEDFIGYEALLKIKEEGPRWKLCCFTLDTDKPRLLRGGETICHRGQVLGVVTSGGYGHTVGKTIAYGYVPFVDSNYDDGYEIEVYKEVIPATRHERTLYDPERKKIFI